MTDPVIDSTDIEDEDLDLPVEIAVTVYLQVTDPEAFRKAALEHAIQEDGMSEEEALEYFGPGADLGTCARVLIDPGISPPGCEIIDSTAG